MNKEKFSAAASPALVWVAGLHRLLLLLTAACLLAACGTIGAAQVEGVQGERAATAATKVAAEYPEPLRGHWLPKGMACASPISYDSDSLIVIDKARLAHYEDGNKPVRVRRISDEPQAWVIEFKSCLVDSEQYLLRCSRYIELNPVRARMVEAPGLYPWSSYAVNA